MVAAATDPTVTAAGADSPRNVPLPTEESPFGAAPIIPKLPGRRPFLEQFNLPPNREGVPEEFQEQAAKVEEI